MRMWFVHFPPLFDQLNGLQPTVIKLWGDESHDGIAEDFRMLNLVHPGGSRACCRWRDTCNWSLRVCSGQSWILMFRSVNTHLMTLHKPTRIECSDSCPKLSNSGGLSEAFIAPVRNRFPTRLKSKEVKVKQEITGKGTIKVKLSSRAVV